MSPFVKKGILVLGLLVAVALITGTYRPQASPVGGDRLNLFPPVVGDWRSLKDVEVTSVVWSALDPKAMVFREYRNPAASPPGQAWLVIVYHENDRWGAHDPQVCWISQGWKIDKRGQGDTVRVALPNGRYADKFVVGKGAERRIVLYWWFTSGKRQMPDRLSQMLAMVWNGILRGYTESGFVRVDGPIIGADEERTLRTLLSFAGEVSERLDEFIP